MAGKDSEYRDRRNNVNKRGSSFSPEGMIEDEEDYEEFVRSMERKNRKAAPSTGKQSARPASGGGRRRPESAGGRENGNFRGDFHPARDLDDEPDYYDPGRREIKGGQRQYTEEREGVRNDGSGGQGNGSGKRRKGGIGSVILKIFLILLLLIVIAGGLLFYKVKDVLKLQRVNSIDLEEELSPGIPYKVRADEYMNGYKNIALFGVDSRSGDLLEGDNRSDTMMICSINESTGEIKLVSLYRDTLLDVGDGQYRKANTAYAIGGPSQAIDMMNKNLDLNIVDFVTVGFEGLAHTIDALGGIEIEIDEEERGYLNQYVHDMERGYLNQYVHDMHLELGTEDTPVESAGLVTMNGIQATAYSRIRYTAGDDFRRAERQRTVLSKTLEKVRSASPATLVKVADNVMGDVATSLSSSELLGLIMKAGKADLSATGGVPLEEYRGFRTNYDEGDYVLPMDLSDNVIWLHEFLFNESDYTLSDEAKARNTAIQEYGMYNRSE